MTVFDARSVSPLLDLLFEGSEVGRCLVAPDGSVLRANQAWLRSTGFRLDDVLGANVLDLFPGTRDMALALHARARAGHHVEVPRHAQTVHGCETWWEGSIDPVPMEGGAGLLITAREVTVEGARPAKGPGGQRGPAERADETEEAYRAAFDYASSAIQIGELLFDAGGKPVDVKMLRVNPAYEKQTGLLASQVVGRRIKEVIPQVEQVWLDRYADMMRRGTTIHFEDRVESMDSWFEVRATPLTGNRFIAIFEDVTARRRAEAALGDSERKVSATERDLDAMTSLHRLSARFVHAGELPKGLLEEVVDVAIAITHADMGNIQLVDPVSRRLRIAAYRGHERWWLDFFASVADRQGGASCGQALQTGARVVVEDVETSPVFAGTPALEIQRRAGIRAVQSTPLFASSGDLVGMISTHFRAPGRPDERDLRLLDLLARQAADMIERVRGEAALRETEEQLSAMFDHAPFGVVLTEMPGGRTIKVNEAFLRILECRREDVLGRTSREVGLSSEVDQRQVSELLRREGRVRDLEVTRQTLAGNRRVLSLNVDMVTIAGRPFVVSTFADITERRQAELALRESEEAARNRAKELETVLNAVPAAVWIARDPRGDRIDANQFGAALLRRHVDQNVSLTATGGDAPREFRVERDGRALAGDELPIQRAARFGEEIRDAAIDLVFEDGEVRHLLGNSVPLRSAAGQVVGSVGAFIDVTERKQAEAERERTTGELRAILDTAPVGIWIAHDPECRTITGNAFANGIMRAPPAGNVSASAPPGEAAVKYRVLRGEKELRPDELPAQVAASTGRPVASGALELRFEDGRSVHLLEAAVPLLDANGLVRGAVAAAADVSELTRAEEGLRRANEQLREADRRKNEFLAVLSHELRNPLAPIRNSVYLLERAAPGTEQFTRAKEVLRRQADHLARLVDDLLDVMRITRGKVDLQRRRVDLRDLVRKSMDDSRSLFERKGITLRVEHALGPVWLEADPTRITQVIGNVLHNAQKFTPAGGVVTVTMVTEDGRVRLGITDTGAGMVPGQEERMFEPFAQGEQDAARTGGGLGLGLSLVKSLVEMHGGSVSARSEGRGRGTEVVMRLPLAKTSAIAAPPTAVQATTAARDVLVIEDNADSAETLAGVLALQGHTVRVATDGRAGLALAAERAPDVILCDLGLPGMDGYEVARAVRGDPALAGVQLVALTGYAQPEDRQRTSEAGFDAHVAKPPDPDELARLLRSGPDRTRT